MSDTHEIDRDGWSAGPWDTEPDRVEWTTDAGLPGLIVRNRMGAWCGYAAVLPGHPWHGSDYDDVEVDVHGGLTYSDRCMEDGPICHVPAEGEPGDVWWLGFDCGHFMDLMPGLVAMDAKMGLTSYVPPSSYVYRDMAYVSAEVESLARQIVEAK